jgi:hypothetical protein
VNVAPRPGAVVRQNPVRAETIDDSAKGLEFSPARCFATANPTAEWTVRQLLQSFHVEVQHPPWLPRNARHAGVMMRPTLTTDSAGPRSAL